MKLVWFDLAPGNSSLIVQTLAEQFNCSCVNCCETRSLNARQLERPWKSKQRCYRLLQETNRPHTGRTLVADPESSTPLNTNCATGRDSEPVPPNSHPHNLESKGLRRWCIAYRITGFLDFVHPPEY
jgi:hypothetical protein